LSYGLIVVFVGRGWWMILLGHLSYHCVPWRERHALFPSHHD
jgi:hypothetical protein